ncbi:cell wall / vacuolar inhibitor of fructosidase 2-like [Eucalyptus grandis]|uniref:cell wall / vacuolar inhibitor of fructosidase 2-like n=1 Tax=Eucalyptus grandis TaxID=71139 RepID=UPI00192F0978|nr:cell wall / vacuolar inhibitor of fructosidase 2-like [Eucalyptus grandis]
MGLQISASSCLLILAVAAAASAAAAVAPPAKPDTALIQKVCRATKYYGLCLSTLKSDPSSSRADPRGLASISLAAALANATSASSFLSSLALGASCGGSCGDPALSRLLLDCADKYGLAGDALRASALDVAAEAYDYAYVHAMAAEDYPSACRDAFRRSPAGTAYPPELARREDGLKRICDVVLGIIEFLGS